MKEHNIWANKRDLQNLILLARTTTFQSLFSMVSNFSIGEEYAFDIRASLRLHIWTSKTFPSVDCYTFNFFSVMF